MCAIGEVLKLRLISRIGDEHSTRCNGASVKGRNGEGNPLYGLTTFERLMSV